MAKTKTKNKSSQLNIVDQKIGGIICESFIQFGDVILIIDASGERILFNKESITEKPKEHKIDGQKVDEITFSNDHSLFILVCGNQTYFRDKSNQKIQGSEEWEDFYLEPFTSSFFRKDNRDRWYDVQGFQLKTPFLIKDQVLCSLVGKTSKKSLFYRDQLLYINPKNTMVQVGKVVYDINLNLISYFGEKITGLGQSNVSFDPDNSIQEIHLGLINRAFIHEKTYEPFIINSEEITNYISEITMGKYTFHTFRSEENEYMVCGEIDNVLQYKNKALTVDFESHISIGQFEIIRVNDGVQGFYFDLESRLPFDPLGNGELVTEVDHFSFKKENDLLQNLTFTNEKVVYNSSKKCVFKIGKNAIIPEQISPVKGFEKHFFYAKIEGVNKLCNYKTNEVISLENQSLEIGKVLSNSNQKLINIQSTDNQNYVLDTRLGFDNLSLAKIEDFRIIEAIGNPITLGDKILQNVQVETLGGTQNRVVNLNDPNLSMFQLPKDLMAYSEQSLPSIFAGNIITQIDLINRIQIEDKFFYNSTFLTYLNEPKSIILQQENARPLQLDGVGHKNEIVQQFDDTTLSKKYYLSDHRIIGVNSLTEDLKTTQLLFSFKTMSSWLPFYDTYLPIFKKIKDFEKFQHWEYHLFELHNMSTEKEYVAVEQNAPYRILADKSKSKYTPRIVKSKEIILKSPEEISAIRRFFSNPGQLVDIG